MAEELTKKIVADAYSAPKRTSGAPSLLSLASHQRQQKVAQEDARRRELQRKRELQIQEQQRLQREREEQLKKQISPQHYIRSAGVIQQPKSQQQQQQHSRQQRPSTRQQQPSPQHYIRQGSAQQRPSAPQQQQLLQQQQKPSPQHYIRSGSVPQRAEATTSAADLPPSGRKTPSLTKHGSLYDPPKAPTGALQRRRSFKVKSERSSEERGEQLKRAKSVGVSKAGEEEDEVDENDERAFINRGELRTFPLYHVSSRICVRGT